MKKMEEFLSVVVPLTKGINGLETYLSDLHGYLTKNFDDFEIIIADGSSRAKGIDGDFFKRFSCIRYLRLKSNENLESLFAAGVENAIGDYVILFRLGVDPTQVISDILQECVNHNTIVVGVSEQPPPLPYRFLRAMVSRLLKQINYNIPQNATTLRCLPREIVNTLTTSYRLSMELFLRMHGLGYESKTYSYQRIGDANAQSSIIAKISQFFYLIVFNSTYPLRYINLFGLFGSFAALVIGAYSILVRLITGHVVEGWTTLVLFISFLFFITFIILFFLGEYLVRIIQDQSHTSNSAILYEKNSDTMINADRKNISTNASN